MDSINSQSGVIKWLNILKQVLLAPRSFFLDLSSQANLQGGVVFGGVCAGFGFLFNLLFELSILQFFFGGAFYNLEALTLLSEAFALPPLELAPILTEQSKAFIFQKMLMGFFAPILFFFFIHLFASALYFSVKGLLAQGKKQLEYSEFLNMVGFAQAPMIFAFIPFFGPIIAFFWMLRLVMLVLRPFTQIGPFFRASIVCMPAMMIYVLWSSAFGSLSLNLSKDFIKAPFDESVLVENLKKAKELSDR